MHGFELLDADLGVNGGGFELLVAEELLDEPDVGPAFQHVGGAGGADQVATAGAADVGLSDPFADHAAEHVGIEGLAVAGEEQGALAGIERKPRADLVKVAFQPEQGAAADRHDAVLVALALADVQGLALAVEVVDFESGEFAAAQPGAVEEFEHGAVAPPQRIADVGDVDDGGDLLDAEGLPGQALFLAGHFQFAGRVGGDEVAFGQA